MRIVLANDPVQTTTLGNLHPGDVFRKEGPAAVVGCRFMVIPPDAEFFGKQKGRVYYVRLDNGLLCYDGEDVLVVKVSGAYMED